MALNQLVAQDSFTQITSPDELTSGEYLIVADGSTNDGIMLNQTISTPAITYTPVTNPGTTITEGFTGDNIFTVTVTGSNITIYHASVGYVSWGRSGVTGNHATFYNDTPESYETWTASVSDGLWSLVNGNNTTRILQWNNGSPRFAAYTTNQVKLKLYKKEITEPSGYTITVTQPMGGSISPEGVVEVEEGENAEFTATADSGCYTFSHWVVDGENAGDTNPYIFTNVTADHTITAVFDAAAPNTITATAGANGTISPIGEISVNCGEDQAFTFTPDAGFIVADVLVDGTSVGAVNSYTFTEVVENHTISVSFEEFSEPGEFCGNEDFENIPTASPGSYLTRIWTGNNSIDWSATDARTDQTLTGKAIGLRNSILTNTSTINGGIGTISFDYKRIYSGNSTLKVFINGTQYGGDISVSEETPITFSTEVNLTGDVTIEIINSGNRIAVDNLAWTCPEPSCETPLPTAVAQSFCGITTVADLAAEGTDIKWYDSLDATEALSSETEVTTGTYYVTQTIGCESEKLAVEITVNAIPDAPVAEAQTFCEDATVAGLIAEGTEIKWYETEDSTEPLATDFVLVTGTYYASQTIGECESERLAVEITINAAPVFTTQPVDQTVSPGETAVFTSEVEGDSDFQWSISTDGGTNWTVLDGAIEANYTTEPATLEMNGNQYRVTATNDCGETISEIAILNVEELSCDGLEDFETTDIPAAYSDGEFTHNGITWTYGHSRNEENFAIEGKGLMLRRASDSYLEATFELGVGEFTFEYRKAFTGGNERQLELIVNGEQVATTPVFGAGSGEDPTVHTFTHTLNIAGPVLIQIKNVGTSADNRQTVIDNISWTCPEESCETPLPTAESQIFCGEATVADLVAEGENIQWYETQTSTEPLAPEVTLVTGTYYATQTIDCESDRLAVDVLISEGPVFILQPEDQTVSEGETATFITEVEGATEFQWSVSTDEGASWTIIDGATETTYTTEPATAEMNGNQYRVTAINDCGETISEIAVLTLVGEPCYVEDFETAEISDSYSDGSFTNNGITWTYGHSRNQGNFPIEEKGLMLRRASDSYLEATIPAGAGVFSFEYRKAFTGGNERQLELIVDGEQVATTPIFGTGSGEDPTVYTFSFALNTTEDVVIRIKNIGETDVNRQTVIDNISWTCAEEPCDIPAPIAIGNFEFVAGNTLADLEDSLEYTGTLTWYGDEELTIVLPNTTLLEDGAVYFVTQTIGECESDALTVETYELGINAYGLDSFSFYPNPVKDILSLKNGSVINRVEIYNLSGAKAWTNEINAANAELNLSGLDTGIYVMKITAGKEVKTVKIIKK
ncbi:MAG TPA: T9SS type A sorting domain-containing protein [Moheibacter sp.]|nr:T9SS type A sorting domain-containing protein [Moheibacter sp.]